MAVTLKALREKAPTPMYAMLTDAALTASPIMSMLGWQATTSDELAYRRRRGTATAPHYSPDSTLAAGTDETYDPIVARIRPFGGQVETPIIGTGHGDPMEDAESKAIAAAKQFMYSFVNGGFIETATVSPTLTANDGIVVGPHFELSARGEILLLKVRVNAGERYISLKRAGDTDWGNEWPDGFTAATDMVAQADGTYRFHCKNPEYWIDITLDVSDLSAILANTIHEIALTSTNNRFDGLYKLCRYDQTLNVATAAGETLDIGHIDRVLRTMKTTGRKAILLAERDFDALLAENRTLGGATFQEVSGFGKVLSYRGALVMAEEYMPTNLLFNGARGVAGAAVNASSIIGIDLDRGVRGLFKSNVPQTGVYDGKSWGGFYARKLGESHTSDNELYRITWYASIMHMDAQGLVILDGIIP